MEIMIDGIEYAPVQSAGNRAVVVADNGWIFAGDVRRANGRIYMTKCLWVFSWEDIGFFGVIDDPASKKCDIRRIGNLEIPEASEIYSIPVGDDWGLL